MKDAVKVQQGTLVKMEAGQVGLWGCNPPASMNTTKSKVPRSYTIPVRKGSVHPGSPRAEWTFPGTNPRISPETEAWKLCWCCAVLEIHESPMELLCSLQLFTFQIDTNYRHSAYPLSDQDIPGYKKQKHCFQSRLYFYSAVVFTYKYSCGGNDGVLHKEFFSSSLQ